MKDEVVVLLVIEIEKYLAHDLLETIIYYVKKFYFFLLLLFLSN